MRSQSVKTGLVRLLLMMTWACCGNPRALFADPAWTIKFTDNPALRTAPFKQLEIARADGSAMTAFLGVFDAQGINRKKHLMIFCDGSGAQSLFQKRGDKVGYTGFGVLAKAAVQDYHLLAIEKRGVQFCGSVERPGCGEGASQEYNEHATLEDRVEDVCLLIDRMSKQPTIDGSRVIIVGISEGVQVAAEVAAKDRRVTHCVCLSGCAPCQVFDLAVLQRKHMMKDGRSPEEIEAAIEEIQADYKRILDDPTSATKFWIGHAYRRWSSFTRTSALESLKKSNCKLFLAHGTADESSSIESFDACVFELMSCGRKHMTVRRYPGRSHGLLTPGINGGDAFKDIYDDLLKWASD